MKNYRIKASDSALKGTSPAKLVSIKFLGAGEIWEGEVDVTTRPYMWLCGVWGEGVEFRCASDLNKKLS